MGAPTSQEKKKVKGCIILWYPKCHRPRISSCHKEGEVEQRSQCWKQVWQPSMTFDWDCSHFIIMAQPKHKQWQVLGFALNCQYPCFKARSLGAAVIAASPDSGTLAKLMGWLLAGGWGWPMMSLWGRMMAA